jgi:predicted PurR-regulated permease PerM
VSNENGGRERLSLGDVARRTAVIIGVILGVVVVIELILQLRTILVWVLVAVMLALTIAPLVGWLERHRLPRWLAATLVTILGALIVLGAVAAVAVPMVRQSQQLLNNLPHLARDLFKHGSPLAFLDERFHMQARIRSINTSTVLHLLTGARSSVIEVFTRMVAFIAATVTVITITLMLLLEGPRQWKRFIRSLGEGGARVDYVARRMQATVAGYVRGNLLISLFASVGAFIAMSILRVPYPLPLALAVGLLDIIPLIGAMLGAAVCVIVALSHGWVIAMILIIYFVIYQQMENHLLLPVIYSRTVAMSPLTVLLVSLAGAVLGGLVGVLLAIPLASAAVIIIGELARRHGVGDLAGLAGAMSEESGPILLSEDDDTEPPGGKGMAPREKPEPGPAGRQRAAGAAKPPRSR